MKTSNKQEHLNILFEYKQKLRRSPQLRFLFLELTMRCNEYCRHCGSRCNDLVCDELTADEWCRFLDKIAHDFAPELPMLCITGGEPLLRKEFSQIMSYAKSLGFKWGMTSNATLIDEQTVQMLKQTGMNTISVSLDGTRRTHDDFRRTAGGFDKAVNGIRCLVRGGFDEVQVTTVVTKKSISELPEVFEIVKQLNVDSWRVVGIEPIGRALELEDYMLSIEQQYALLDFIKQKRSEGWNVTYGCSHYLGLELEREVRDWYFLCSAGVYVASITANGDITACLDIQRRAEVIQGNIKKDDFMPVWKNRFQIFREPLWKKSEKCRNCKSRDYCEGGSFHSWDLDRNEQRICFIDPLIKIT